MAIKTHDSLSLNCLTVMNVRDPPSMAGTGEGSAFPEKLKPDLPSSVNITPDEKIDVEEENSISIPKKKLESKNDKNDTLSFFVDDKLTESKKSINICDAEKEEGGGDGKEDNKVDADGSKVEPEFFDWEGKRFTAIEKGKGILIEESETDDDYCSDDSTDGFDSDFCNELECDMEDDLSPEVD